MASMLQNTCKFIGFKKNMVFKIPGGEVGGGGGRVVRGGGEASGQGHKLCISQSAKNQGILNNRRMYAVLARYSWFC